MKKFLTLALLSLSSTIVFADTASLSEILSANVETEIIHESVKYVCNVLVLGQYNNLRSKSEVAITYRDVEAISAKKAVGKAFVQLQSDQSEKAKNILQTFGIDEVEITCSSI